MSTQFLVYDSRQVDVTLAGISGSNPVKCSRGVIVVPDKSLSEVANQVFDAVVLPGGGY